MLDKLLLYVVPTCSEFIEISLYILILSYIQSSESSRANESIISSTTYNNK